MNSLEFRVWSLGLIVGSFRLYGLGFRVEGLGLRVYHGHVVMSAAFSSA